MESLSVTLFLELICGSMLIICSISGKEMSISSISGGLWIGKWWLCFMRSMQVGLLLFLYLDLMSINFVFIVFKIELNLSF